MNVFRLNQMLQKQVILLSFLVISSLFVSENATSSQKKWNRGNLFIGYKSLDNEIVIDFYFIDYEFGPLSQHAYFEWVDFEYSLNGVHYEKLFSCEVKDQMRADSSIMYLKNKLPDAKIQIIKDFYKPKIYTYWEEKTNVRTNFKNHQNFGTFYLVWLLSQGMKIHSFKINGLWHVNGLNCSEYISEVYPIVYSSKLTTEQRTVLKQQYLNAMDDQLENNAEMVYKETDAVVIKNADRGENIKIFTTTGRQINETVANSDLVKIKLPCNQIYIIHIGHARHKVAL